MNIHKFNGNNEKEAMDKIKQELGENALILSIKQIKPNGIMKLFRKPYVEITAALDNEKIEKQKPNILPSINLKAEDLKKINKKEMDVGAEEEFKKFLTKYSNKQSNKKEYEPIDKEKKIHQNKEQTIESFEELKLIYEQLIENEVTEKNANKIMEGLQEICIKGDFNIDYLVNIVYDRMVKILSQINTIGLKTKAKVVFFIGPTGVGKTTTIAKLASIHSLKHKKDIALITADTYRIAAVEQLKTYANILNIPMEVVYGNKEIISAIESFQEKDYIFIDTAGRSHKDTEHQYELQKLLDSVVQKEIFLVVSSGTKYKDLIKIIDNYVGFCNFNIIWSKLDETTSYGNILNIAMKYNLKLSYATYGQNVPDDITIFDANDIAGKILGGEENGSS